MPFQSERQRRYMHMKHPEIAKRWEKKYGSKPKKKETISLVTFKHPGHANQKVHSPRTSLKPTASRLLITGGAAGGALLGGTAGFVAGGIVGGVGSRGNFASIANAAITGSRVGGAIGFGAGGYGGYKLARRMIRRKLRKVRRKSATFKITLKHPGHANQSVHGKRGGSRKVTSGKRTGNKKLSTAKKRTVSRASLPKKEGKLARLGKFLQSPAGRELLKLGLEHGPGMARQIGGAASRGARRLSNSEFGDVVRGGGRQGTVRYRISRRGTIRSWFPRRKEITFKHPGHGSQKVHGAWARGGVAVRKVGSTLQRANEARIRFRNSPTARLISSGGNLAASMAVTSMMGVPHDPVGGMIRSLALGKTTQSIGPFAKEITDALGSSSNPKLRRAGKILGTSGLDRGYSILRRGLRSKRPGIRKLSDRGLRSLSRLTSPQAERVGSTLFRFAIEYGNYRTSQRTASLRRQFAPKRKPRD